jgi:hypothetical protein
MAKLKWPDKDPQDFADYTLDWSARVIAPETITSSAWVVEPQTDSSDDTLVIDSDEVADDATLVWLDEGTAGLTYALRNHIFTSGGREWDQTVYIKVKQR